MADDQTTAAPAPAPGIDYSALTPEMVNALIARATGPLPNIQPDQTPVDNSGFWGGLRHGISLLGEFAGSPGPEVLKTLSPAEREQAGFQALSRFGTGLMAASHYVPGQTFGSNLAQGFQAAERGYDTTARQAAGLLGAQQAYAIQNQQGDLAKLKEVIPLLQLQANQRAVGALPATLGGGGKPGTPPPGTSIATGGSIGGPLLDALANIESGDRNIVSRVDKDSQGKTLAQGGNAAEISQGHFQIQTATWKDFAGKAGVDTDQYPTAMSAPRDVQERVASVIPLSRFGPRTRELLRTRFGPLDTSQTVGALAGTPALTFAPGAAGPRIAAAPPPTAAAGAPVPPPPVRTQPPGTTVAMPPRVQTAGPGAGTAPSAPPPGPTAQAAAPPDAPWLPGQVGPATGPLAPPEQAAPPAVPPASAPPLPPGLDPNSREAFGILHPIVPSAEERALFNKGLTPEQQQAHDTQLQALQQQYQTARMRGDPAAMAAVQEKLVTLETATSTLRENARKLGTEREANFYEKRQAALDAAHAAEQADRRAQAAAQQLQQRKLDEIAATAKEARDTEAAKQEGQYILDDRKEFSKDREGARQAIDKVQVLRALSDRAGTATPLENITLPNGQTMRDLMVQTGMGTEDSLKHLNAQQAYETAATDMVMALRKGVPMGSLSDRDLMFLQKLVPKGSVDPETRANILATVEQAYARKREYIDRVHQLWDQGHGLSWEKAKVEADKQMGDIVTQVPQAYRTMTPEQRADWFKTNAPPRALIRTMDEVDNTGKVTRRGHIIQVPEAPQ